LRFFIRLSNQEKEKEDKPRQPTNQTSSVAHASRVAMNFG